MWNLQNDRTIVLFQSQDELKPIHFRIDKDFVFESCLKNLLKLLLLWGADSFLCALPLRACLSVASDLEGRRWHSLGLPASSTVILTGI